MIDLSPRFPEVVVAGERLVLLPQRAAYWPARQTLFVADLHIGKAATFRAAGAPVPPGTTTETLERLSEALEIAGSDRLVVLGDLFHARPGREAGRTMDALARWRERWPDLRVEVVRGNHDRHAGDAPASLGFVAVEEPFADGPFRLKHFPDAEPDGYVLAGHLHPAVVLRGGGERLRLPCFYFGERVGILPAFGALTGTATMRPVHGDRVFVIADGEVLEV